MRSLELEIKLLGLDRPRINMQPIDISRTSLAQPEVMGLKKYFEIAKRFPAVLVTQNKGAMQQAYVMVPIDVWTERMIDLQNALQSSKTNTTMRRNLVTLRSAGMSPLVDDVLDRAFLEKYDELMERIIYDFEDFFPYNVTATNQKSMIFEKMRDLELVQYVLKKF